MKLLYLSDWDWNPEPCFFCLMARAGKLLLLSGLFPQTRPETRWELCTWFLFWGQRITPAFRLSGQRCSVSIQWVKGFSLVTATEDPVSFPRVSRHPHLKEKPSEADGVRGHWVQNWWVGICHASGPITSWEIDGETVETVSDFFVGGLQYHCRWWLQPWN